jgi:hypothetical protein
MKWAFAIFVFLILLAWLPVRRFILLQKLSPSAFLHPMAPYLDLEIALRYLKRNNLRKPFCVIFLLAISTVLVMSMISWIGYLVYQFST